MESERLFLKQRLYKDPWIMQADPLILKSIKIKSQNHWVERYLNLFLTAWCFRTDLLCHSGLCKCAKEKESLRLQHMHCGPSWAHRIPRLTSVWANLCFAAQEWQPESLLLREREETQYHGETSIAVSTGSWEAAATPHDPAPAQHLH